LTNDRHKPTNTDQNESRPSTKTGARFHLLLDKHCLHISCSAQARLLDGAGRTVDDTPPIAAPTRVYSRRGHGHPAI
jgi:hypothetical protein